MIQTKMKMMTLLTKKKLKMIIVMRVMREVGEDSDEFEGLAIYHEDEME